MEALIMSIRAASVRNITQTHALPQWEKPIESYPLINQQGTDYHLVPLAIIQKLRTEKESLVWLSIGLGAMLAAALVALVAGAFKGETKVITIDKPVIVTQEKVVPTNCLIFCK